jgi:hypothetical protein
MAPSDERFLAQTGLGAMTHVEIGPSQNQNFELFYGESVM